MSIADGQAWKLCTLESALGVTTPCPGEQCPFWEREHEQAAAACIFDDVAIALQQTDVAHELLALRNRLLELWPTGRPEGPPREA